MPFRLSHNAAGFSEGFDAFIARRRDVAVDVSGLVADFVADVRQRGDAAGLDYTSRFDRRDLSGGLRLDPSLIEAARDACPPDQIVALETAATRIRAFHERQLPDGISFTDADGVRLGARWTPVSAAGIAFISTELG